MTALTFSFDAIAERCKPLLDAAIFPSFRNFLSSDHW
jgi:hypothetical protein